MNTSRVGRLILYQWFAAKAKVRMKLPAFQLLVVPAGLEHLSYPLTTALVDNQENYFPHYLTAVGIDLLFLEEYLRLAPRQN